MTDPLRRERRTTIAVTVLVTLGVVAGVLVYLVGRWQKDDQRIGRVAAVEILSTTWRHRSAPVRFGTTVANELAQHVDTLPSMPSGEMTCGEETGLGYVLRFRAGRTAGPVVRIDRGGCLGVNATLAGSSYGPTWWDPDAELRRAIARALATR